MNIIKKTRKIFALEKQIELAKNSLVYNQLELVLTEKTLNSNELGISKDMLCQKEVIVSLTTYGKRIYEVYLAIESIMQGSVKPNRIVLWLSDELEKKELPVTLQKLQKRGLDVFYCKDIRSYTKLIPSLKKYPDACIITIDDDIIYKYDLVEKLVAAYKKEPHFIHANRIHRVRLDKKGMPISYLKWELCSPKEELSSLNFLTGVGGVLYPPNSLHPEVFNEDVFLSICKYADDIWFYAMALYNDTIIKKCHTHHPFGIDYYVNDSVQETGLNRINTSKEKCLNDTQLKAVFFKYNLFSKLINNEK